MTGARVTFKYLIRQQWEGGRYVNRYDVTLFINGLPVVQIELKRRALDYQQTALKAKVAT